jgi:hypothetical protein
VAVQAQLEQGNFEALNARWGELQETLSAQGIRLEDLHEADSMRFAGGPFPDASSRRDPNADGAGAGDSPLHSLRAAAASPVSSTTPSSPRDAAGELAIGSSGRSWESWA